MAENGNYATTSGGPSCREGSLGGTLTKPASRLNVAGRGTRKEQALPDFGRSVAFSLESLHDVRPGVCKPVRIDCFARTWGQVEPKRGAGVGDSRPGVKAYCPYLVQIWRLWPLPF
jgi:hypothetical protein